MRFAICNETFQGWDWPGTCRFVAETGYDGIEIAPFTLAPDVRTLSPEERTRIRAVAEDAGLPITALRFPMTATREDLLEHARRTTEDPASRVREAWSYLDVRDAARAVVLSLLSTEPGANPVFVAADTTCVPFPTEALLDRFAGGTARLRRFVDREVPIDLTVARTLLGFQAAHPLPVEPAPLPPADVGH